MNTKLYLTIPAVVAILYALGFLLIPVQASLFFSGCGVGEFLGDRANPATKV